jgi:hypothetical protein
MLHPINATCPHLALSRLDILEHLCEDRVPCVLEIAQDARILDAHLVTEGRGGDRSEKITRHRESKNKLRTRFKENPRGAPPLG